MRLAVDRHLALLHGLEQRGLRLGAGAVDLVREEDLRKHRTRPELEVVFLLVDDRAADVRHEGIGNSGDDFGYHALPTMSGIIDLTFLQPFEVNTHGRAIWFRNSLR